MAIMRTRIPWLMPLLAALLLASQATLVAAETKADKPNILLIVADDLGWGDVGSYGATKIKTPRIDQLAGAGVRFTDAHSTASVCTPSRYSILSGTYPQYGKLVLNYSLSFHEGQVTLPSLLKSAGYRTAALGKWHNGFGRGATDWNKELPPGPLEIGFDYFFGTPLTHNEPPLVFVENHRVLALDPADPIRIDHKVKPHGMMTGGAAAQQARPDDQIDFIVAEKATQFIAQQMKDQPFFLYLAFAAPHVPINPAQDFRGKSAAGLYGDYVEQLDYCTGLVLDALEKQGLAQNTLVIFTSDNGAVLHPSALESSHRPNGALLGQKTDGWEGGHRVPLLARWPGRIPAGSERRHMFTQVDFMATIAEAAGVTMPEGASPDGVSELNAFTSPERAPVKRAETFFLTIGGTILRQGDWLYIPKQGSMGWTVPIQPGLQQGPAHYAQLGLTNSDVTAQGEVKPDAPKAQLYNLKDDLSQRTNVIAQHPQIAARMYMRMHRPWRQQPSD